MADDGSDFARSMGIATSGLRAQAGRMRVISENIANADSTAQGAGGRCRGIRIGDIFRDHPHPPRLRAQARRRDAHRAGEIPSVFCHDVVPLSLSGL